MSTETRYTEALHIWWSGLPELPQDAGKLTMADIRRMNELAGNWLAEHPADDDEPVTGKWLESLAFNRARELRVIDADGDPCVLEWDAEDSVMLVYPADDDPWTAFPASTRGDVRRLLRALGHAAE